MWRFRRTRSITSRVARPKAHRLFEDARSLREPLALLGSHGGHAGLPAPSGHRGFLGAHDAENPMRGKRIRATAGTARSSASSPRRSARAKGRAGARELAAWRGDRRIGCSWSSEMRAVMGAPRPRPMRRHRLVRAATGPVTRRGRPRTVRPRSSSPDADPRRSDRPRGRHWRRQRPGGDVHGPREAPDRPRRVGHELLALLVRSVRAWSRRRGDRTARAGGALFELRGNRPRVTGRARRACTAPRIPRPRTVPCPLPARAPRLAASRPSPGRTRCNRWRAASPSRSRR